VFGVRHLRALAALPQLVVVNLYHLTWADERTSDALTTLVHSLPHLRVLNAPFYALVCPCCMSAAWCISNCDLQRIKSTSMQCQVAALRISESLMAFQLGLHDG
jgi:hypothetical protein